MVLIEVLLLLMSELRLEDLGDDATEAPDITFLALLLHNDLWWAVPSSISDWGRWSLYTLIFFSKCSSGHSKVTEPNLAMLCHHDVLWLDVSVFDSD